MRESVVPTVNELSAMLIGLVYGCWSMVSHTPACIVLEEVHIVSDKYEKVPPMDTMAIIIRLNSSNFADVLILIHLLLSFYLIGHIIIVGSMLVPDTGKKPRVPVGKTKAAIGNSIISTVKTSSKLLIAIFMSYEWKLKG